MSGPQVLFLCFRIEGLVSSDIALEEPEKLTAVPEVDIEEDRRLNQQGGSLPKTQGPRAQSWRRNLKGRLS